MNKEKLVSVIIPAYNKAELTVSTVKSVLEQSYKSIEILVIDDGSNDDTAEKLKFFGDKIKYIYQSNKGASSARNLGTKNSQGVYLAYLDCDDIYYPEKIKKSIDLLEKNIQYGFLYTNVHQIGERNQIVGEFPDILNYGKSGSIFNELIFHNFICNSTLVIRRECIDKIGYFDEKIFVPADWDFLLRLSQKYLGCYLPEKLTGYRIGEQSTLNHLENVVEEYTYVINKNTQNNNNLPKKIINNSFASAYYFHAKNFAATSNIYKSKDLFLLSLKYGLNHPKFFKMIIGYLMCTFLPKKWIVNYFKKKQIFNQQ
tara:strand:- start:137 stop:1078 length:942 start_codon:yes stop_codon:yes gene_type:complete